MSKCILKKSYALALVFAFYCLADCIACIPKDREAAEKSLPRPIKKESSAKKTEPKPPARKPAAKSGPAPKAAEPAPKAAEPAPKVAKLASVPIIKERPAQPAAEEKPAPPARRPEPKQVSAPKAAEPKPEPVMKEKPAPPARRPEPKQVSAPKAAEPKPEPVMKEKPAPPARRPKPKPEPAPKPEPEVHEVVAVVDDVVITMQEHLQTRSEVEAIVDELNEITRRKDYSRWLAYLDSGYRRTLSNRAYLEQISNSLPKPLRDRRIRLATLKDYFDYVFVPSRQNVRVDDIQYITPTQVYVIMKLANGGRAAVYILEKEDDGKWKLVDKK